MSHSPRHLVEEIEAAPALQPGLDERFNGYGVMGLPFISAIPEQSAFQICSALTLVMR